MADAYDNYFAGTPGGALATKPATRVAPAPSPANDPYDAYFAGEAETDASINLYEANRGDPERAAKAKRLATETALPLETVERNFDDINGRAMLARQRQAMTKDPFLAVWSADPNNARVGADDFDGLLRAGRSFEQIASDVRGRRAGKAAMIEAQRPAGSLASGFRGSAIASAEGFKQSYIGTKLQIADALGLENERAQALGEYDASQERIDASTPRFKSVWTRGLYSGVSSLAQQVPIVATAVATRNPALGLGMTGALVETQSYPKYRARGGTAGEALLGAAGEGAVEVATEMLPLSFIVDSMGKVGIKPFIAGLIGRELPSEQIATIAQDAIDTAIANPEKTWGDYWRERPEAAAETAAATLVPVLGIGGAGAILRARSDQERMQQAEADAELLRKLSVGAVESKTRGRDPSAFARYLALHAEGSPVDKLYIPAERIAEFYQSESLDWQATDDPFFAFQPDFAEQMQQGLASGGDVVVSTADFAAHLAGSKAWDALQDDVRARPDSMSLREARDFSEAYADLVEQRGREALEETEAERLAQAPAQQVAERVTSQLREAGFAPDAASQYAALYAARYEARAARLGTDALSEFERSGVDIRAELPETVARYAKADNISLLANAMRRGKQPPGKRGQSSLVEAIAKRGGMTDPGGDLASMGADRWHKGKPGRRKLLRASQGNAAALPGMGGGQSDGIGYSPDDVAMFAWEQGYFPDMPDRPTVDDLLQAIDRELRGDPIYAPEATTRDADEAMLAAVADLEQIITSAGLDPDTATDAEIRAAVDAYQSDALGGVSYGQALRAQAAINFSRSVDAILEGRAPADTREVISLGRTPEALILAGLPDLPLVYGAAELRKTLTGKHAGAIDAETMRRLPDLLADPTLVMSQDNGRYAALIPDAAGNDVLVVVQPRTYAKSGVSNLVVTTHRKDSAKAILQAVAGGRVTYRHNAKSQRWFEQSSRQLRAGSTAGLPENIPTEADLGKGRSYNQGERGKITFTGNRAIIRLFAERDLSTLLHESGHLWLDELVLDATLPSAPQQMRDDLATVLDWFGITDPAAITAEHHEKFARGVERYLMEGKAPSVGLRRAFDAFRSWLLRIYQVVANLRTPINDDIRDVMNRLLATDEEIAAARNEQNLRALFKDATSAGMTNAEFADYLSSITEAREGAYDALLYRTMEAVRRRRTKEWKAEEAGVRAEVSDSLDRRPEFRALHLLRTGRMIGADPETPRDNVKLSRQAIVDLYGSDALALLPKGVPPLIVETGGVDPDTLAEMVGAVSGDDLIRTLMGLETRQREMRAAGDKRSVRQAIVDAETAAEMADRFGDILNDGSIEEEARNAVYGERQGEVIASEMRALARRAGETPTPMTVARAWARRVVSSSKVRDAVTPAALNRYARAARKAARAAEAAMLARDVDEAFRQKQAQLLNHALYREAKEAQEEVEGAVKRLGKLAKRATAETIDQDYLDQAHDLLEKFNFRQASRKAAAKREALSAFIARQQAAGVDVTEAMAALDRMGGKHYSLLSVEDLRGLNDAVMQLVHLGRLKQTLIDAKEQRDFDAVVDEALAVVETLPQRPPSDLMEPGFVERLKSGVAGFDSALLKVETLVDWLDAGNANGVFNRVVFQPIATAQAAASDRYAAMLGDLNEALRAVPVAQLRRWNARVTANELLNRDTMAPWVLTRQQLISMALNIGNEGNLQRLSDGYGWSEAGIMAVLSRELSKEEWAYVQRVWDIIGTLWPDIAGLEKRLNGVEPEKVEAREVVTPFGTLPGGYYPAVYDTAKDYQAEQNAAKESDLFSASYTRANTRASAAKERSEKVRRPILLNLGVITRHVGEVIHDITHREAVINADKFLSSKRIMAAIDGSLGPEMRKQFRPWLKFVANQWAIERAGNEGVGKFINKLRTNATVVGMGFRVSTIMMQIAGYSNSFERVGARWVGPAIARTAQHPIETFDFVMARSGEVRHRMDNLDRDIDAGIKRLAGKVDALTAAKRFAFHGIGYMDRVVVIPTWIGAYEKALASGSTEDQAVYEADKAVRQSQGAGAAKDLAAVARGTGQWGQALRLMTMFYSYLSAFYQRQRTLGRDIRSASLEDAPGLMARAWWLIVVPPLLAELLAGRGPDEEEEWSWWAFKQMVFQMLGPIPVVRDLARPVWDGIAGNKAFDYQLSPVQSAGQSVVRVAKDVGKVADGGETTRATRNALEVVGYTTGLVPGQFATAAQFLVDVGEGDQDPETVADWWRGLTKGKVAEE